MINKRLFTSLMFICIFLYPPNLYSQSSIELLNQILEKKSERNNARLQRDHEMNMMALDFKLRNQSNQLQYLYNRYQSKLNHFADINTSLKNFGLDYSEQLLNKLPDENKVSTINEEIDFYSGSVIILDDLINQMRNAGTYINRGKSYANQVERDLAIEYFELYHNQKDQGIFEEYTEKILSQFASYDSGISREQRGYMYYGIQYTLLTETHFQKLIDQKKLVSSLIIAQKISELMEQKLTLQRKLLELRKESFQLSEIKSSVEDRKRKEAILDLQILMITSEIDSLDLEIKVLEIEKSKFD